MIKNTGIPMIKNNDKKVQFSDEVRRQLDANVIRLTENNELINNEKIILCYFQQEDTGNKTELYVPKFNILPDLGHRWFIYKIKTV